MIPDNDSTKNALLLSALRIFARKGYRGATVREICAGADSANINSINYYFGSKEKLYRSILEMLYSELGNKTAGNDVLNPVERLKDYIKKSCEMLFAGGEIGAAFLAIYSHELASPSSFSRELSEKHSRPHYLEFYGLMKELLGPGAGEGDIRRCMLSVGGQILYYHFMWQEIKIVFPDHPDMGPYHAILADHVIGFTLGGIDAIKKEISARKKRG